MVFISWQLKKIFFLVWGIPKGPWNILAHFRAKKGYFWPIFHKNQGFQHFKDLFLQNNKEAHLNLSNGSLAHKNCKKKDPKASKIAILGKKNVFFSKKFGKIHTYAQKRLKYGLK